MFGPNGYEMTVGWTKLHNEDLRDLFFSLNQVDEDEMGVAFSTNGGRRTRIGCWWES
jgi:hypothetical protein